jgi:hypothetical protein
VPLSGESQNSESRREFHTQLKQFHDLVCRAHAHTLTRAEYSAIVELAEVLRTLLADDDDSLC